MLERATHKKVSEELGTLRVLRPEDLIGLKLIAAHNNPVRYNKDMGDVQEIFKYYGKKLDYPLLKDYFKTHGIEEKLKEFWKNATD